MKHHTATVLGAVGILAFAALACKKEEGPQPCPARYKELASASAETQCSCPAAPAKGSVWGTDIYTTDSSICGAATHAGALAANQAGTVTVKSAAGCSSYEGSSRNGVQTASWGSYDGSFFFPGHGSPQCPVKAAKLSVCPDSFGSRSQLECECPAAKTNTGSVWGSGTYTTDSSVCRAAVHAGAIGSAGGKVTAKSAKGCGKYSGSEKNGVKTSDWGSFDTSFYFPSEGGPACP